MKPILLLILLMQVVNLCWSLWAYNNPIPQEGAEYKPSFRLGVSEAPSNRGFDPDKFY